MGYNEVPFVLWWESMAGQWKGPDPLLTWEEGWLVSSHRRCLTPSGFWQEALDQEPPAEKVAHLSIQEGHKKPQKMPLP